MKNNHSIDTTFVLVLLCIFAIAILMVLMNGASSYDTVTERMQNNYNERTGVAYITEKVRHCGMRSNIEVTELPEWKDEGNPEGMYESGSHGIEAIAISQEIEDLPYVTYIYYYDGFLREIFTDEGNALMPETGSKILELKSFKARPIGEDLVRIDCEMNDGSISSTVLHLERGSLL